MADCCLSHRYISECLNDRFRRKPPFEPDNVAHYRQRYGDVASDSSMTMLRTEKVSDESA